MASKIEVDEIFNAGGANDTGIDLATNAQILLKVANATRLTMNSTGQTTIVGEGGTTTTNLQQGLAKMWIQFDGTGSISTKDSLNRGGLTDNGTGDYTVTYTNNMANDDYAVPLGMTAYSPSVTAVTTSTVRVGANNSSGSAADSAIVTIAVLGDLA